MNKRILLLVFFASLANQALAADPKCRDWFKNTKIQVNSRDCEIRCASEKVDLGSFYCPDQCDELCKPMRKCEDAEKFWRTKIKNGSPPEWLNKNEKTSVWTKLEMDSIVLALSKIPRELWNTELKGIYRKQKSQKWERNPASELNGAIVIYDAAYSDKKSRLEEVLTHELAHDYWLMLPELQKGHYNLATGWMQEPGTRHWLGRKDGYVEDDGRIDPSEDFANNVQYYLFDRDKLKKVTPSALVWIEQRFGDGFKIGKPCDENKDH